MKKVLLMAMVLVVAVMMSGCGLMGKNTPEGVWVYKNYKPHPNAISRLVTIEFQKINDMNYKIIYSYDDGTVHNVPIQYFPKEKKMIFTKSEKVDNSYYGGFFVFNNEFTEAYEDGKLTEESVLVRKK